MITYQEITARFEKFATDHPMINSYTHGELDVSDLDKNKPFPALHIVPNGVTMDEGVMGYEFEVYVMELFREADDQDLIIRLQLSDCLQLFGDLIADIKNGFEVFDTASDFMLIDPVSVSPFIKEHNGTLNGWQGGLTIQVSFMADACISPLNATPVSSEACADATVENSDQSYQVTVSSGGTLVLSDMTLDKLDGTSTAFEVNPGGSVAQAGTQILQVAAGETTFTWTIGSEISTATVTAEAVTNIDSGWTVTINGGGAVGTLVGVELDNADVLVFTITPTDSGQETEITLTF
jgi:hypothetical protein